MAFWSQALNYFLKRQKIGRFATAEEIEAETQSFVNDEATQNLAALLNAGFDMDDEE